MALSGQAFAESAAGADGKSGHGTPDTLINGCAGYKATHGEYPPFHPLPPVTTLSTEACGKSAKPTCQARGWDFGAAEAHQIYGPKHTIVGYSCIVTCDCKDW